MTWAEGLTRRMIHLQGEKAFESRGHVIRAEKRMRKQNL